MYNILSYMKGIVTGRVFSEFYLLTTPLGISKAASICYTDTTVIYCSVKFLLLSQSHTCNKVHVIPSLIYFMACCCFVYMFNNHCFSQIYFLFAVLARYMSIIFLQSARAAFAFCFSMHTFRLFHIIPP